MPEKQIELTYDSMDVVPEEFRPLYDVVDGKAVLSGVNNMKTPKDITTLQEALRKEREDHGKAKEALKPWADMKPDEVRAQLSRIQELELAAQGKIDETKINEIVEGRVRQKISPLEAQIGGLAKERDTYKSLAETLQQAMDNKDRDDLVRSIALEFKVHNSAIEDILLVAERYLEKSDMGYIVKADAKGVTPGLDVKGFMKEMQKARPHWWPASEGGGALGGSGTNSFDKNPWSHDHWNFTEQSKIVQEQGLAFADRMAKAAGTVVGGTRPVKKK